MDQTALIEAIRLDPADDTLRLAYADWLDEFRSDDQSKATSEFVRVSCPNRTGGAVNRMPRPAYKWLKENWRRLVPKTLTLHRPSAIRTVGQALDAAADSGSVPASDLTDNGDERLVSSRHVGPVVKYWHVVGRVVHLRIRLRGTVGYRGGRCDNRRRFPSFTACAEASCLQKSVLGDRLPGLKGDEMSDYTRSAEVGARYFSQRVTFALTHHIERTDELLARWVCDAITVAVESERDRWKKFLDELVELLGEIDYRSDETTELESLIGRVKELKARVRNFR